MNPAKVQEHYDGPWDAFVGVVKIFLLNQGGTVTVLCLLGAFVCYSLDRHWSNQSAKLEEVRQAEALQSQKFEDAFALMAGSRDRSDKLFQELAETRRAIIDNQSTIQRLIEAVRDKPTSKDGA